MRNVPGGEAEEDARSAAAHLQPAPYDPDISKEINLQAGRYCNPVPGFAYVMLPSLDVADATSHNPIIPHWRLIPHLSHHPA
jgi:hypothetical protein